MGEGGVVAEGEVAVEVGEVDIVEAATEVGEVDVAEEVAVEQGSGLYTNNITFFIYKDSRL